MSSGIKPVARRRSFPGWRRPVLAIAGLLAVLAPMISGAHAMVQPGVKIVGIGAVPCSEFIRDSEPDPVMEKYFFAWAQGYMSGLLWRAPAGVDESLDLVPPSFPMLAQANFIRTFCAAHRHMDYADAVLSLYQELRTRQVR